jgi:hypothetical protein
MTYVNPNFETKRLLKLAIAAGDPVEVIQPSLGTIPENGIVHLEGPHWYASGTMKDGKLVKVVSLLLCLTFAATAHADYQQEFSMSGGGISLDVFAGLLGTVTHIEVPEPSSIVLALVALGGVAGSRKILKLTHSCDPFVGGFVANVSADKGMTWTYRGDLGARTRSLWREYAKNNNYAIREYESHGAAPVLIGPTEEKAY